MNYQRDCHWFYIKLRFIFMFWIWTMEFAKVDESWHDSCNCVNVYYTISTRISNDSLLWLNNCASTSGNMLSFLCKILEKDWSSSWFHLRSLIFNCRLMITIIHFFVSQVYSSLKHDWYPTIKVRMFWNISWLIGWGSKQRRVLIIWKYENSLFWILFSWYFSR